MSKRNMIWLAAVVVVGVAVGVAYGWLVGIVAAGITLIASEVVERSARRRRRAVSGATGSAFRNVFDRRRTGS